MKTKHLQFVVIPLAILCCWQIIGYFRIVSPLFVPNPADVLVRLIESFVSGSTLNDVLYTLYRVVVGFFISVIIGVPLGLLMGYSNRVYNILEFTIEFIRGIPPVALFPLFILVFGIGNGSKLAVTVSGAMIVILTNSMFGVHFGKELRLRVAKTMKINGFELFKRVIFPEALPQIFNGFRVAMSLSLILVIVTEMFIGTNSGLGRWIIDAQLVYETADMYAAIVVTGIVGFFLNKTMIITEKRVVHWKGK